MLKYISRRDIVTLVSEIKRHIIYITAKLLTMSYNDVELASQRPEHFGASVNLGESGVAVVPRDRKWEVLRLSHLLWLMLRVFLEETSLLDVRRLTTTAT